MRSRSMRAAHESVAEAAVAQLALAHQFRPLLVARWRAVKLPSRWIDDRTPGRGPNCGPELEDVVPGVPVGALPSGISGWGPCHRLSTITCEPKRELYFTLARSLCPEIAAPSHRCSKTTEAAAITPGTR